MNQHSIGTRGVLIERAALEALRLGPQNLFRLQQALDPISITGVRKALFRLMTQGTVERLPEKCGGLKCPSCGHRQNKAFVYRVVARQPQRIAS